MTRHTGISRQQALYVYGRVEGVVGVGQPVTRQMRLHLQIRMHQWRTARVEGRQSRRDLQQSIQIGSHDGGGGAQEARITPLPTCSMMSSLVARPIHDDLRAVQYDAHAASEHSSFP